MKLATKTWSGRPIIYVEHKIEDFDPKYTTFICCIDYIWREGTPRFVAVKNGEIVCVQIDSNFANQVVEPLFDGNTLLLPPWYKVEKDESVVYEIPFVRDRNKENNDVRV